MKDVYGRKITYMKIAVVDACNLKCKYCMKNELEAGYTGETLTAEQIIEVAQAAAETGVDVFRLTGGEPLLREDVPQIVRGIKDIYGVRSVGITTNGTLLKKRLPELIDAGLDSVNITIDSMNREHYEAITGSDLRDEVVSAMYAALASGRKVKLNTVIQKQYEEDLDDFLNLIRIYPISVRFVEQIPIGRAKDIEMLGNLEIMRRIRDQYPNLEPAPDLKGAGPAVYYRIPGFQGTIGLISTIHKQFCDGCNRIRMTSRGQLIPCISIPERENLAPILNMPEGNFRFHMLNEAMKYAVAMRPMGHSYTESDFGKK